MGSGEAFAGGGDELAASPDPGTEKEICSMRITFLLPSKELSGGSKSTFEIANRLRARGHEVQVVYPLIPGAHGAQLWDIRSLDRRARGLLWNLRRGNNVPWFDLQIDLVRVAWMRPSSIPCGDVLIATWWADAYVVNRCAPDRGAGFHLIRSYETWGGLEGLVDGAYRLPLHKIAISTWLKDFIAGKFGVTVHGPVFNGIDTTVFFMERDGFEAHEPRRVGLLYRRSPAKGMQDAFRAFREIEKGYPRVTFVVFGETLAEKDAAALRTLKEVEFHPFTYGSALRSIYNSLDVFVLPSLLEGFSNPPLEAMACGAACVLTDIGGVRDYTRPGDTALVVEPGQPYKMAAGVLSLLSDEEKRQRLAAEGHLYVQSFTWDRCVDEIERILAELIPRGG